MTAGFYALDQERTIEPRQLASRRLYSAFTGRIRKVPWRSVDSQDPIFAVIRAAACPVWGFARSSVALFRKSSR